MERTEHDIYLEEYALWKEEQEIKINELDRMIDDSARVNAINTTMKALAKERLRMAEESHQAYLADLEDKA